MAGNSFGTLYKVTTFGESHGRSLGVVIDGCPSNIFFDLDFIQSEMDRRRPGGNKFGTTRNEEDKIEVLSGIFEGKTTGTPITIIVNNKEQISSHYDNIKDIFRPSHADFTYSEKYGNRDYRGGGRSSGRETLSRVIAGALAKLVLKEKGISISAGLVQIGNIKADTTIWNPPFNNDFNCPDEKVIDEMANLIASLREEGDSIGSIVEVRATGLPVGLGEPCFDKTEALLAHAMLSLGAAKGFEIGSGFSSVKEKGSINNDSMPFTTNNNGGTLGGITTGQDLVFRVAFKPTPSISKTQNTIDKDGNNVKININGRHDPVIGPRAVVVTEAMTAITLLDLYLKWRAYFG